MKFIKEVVSQKIPAIETRLKAKIKLSQAPQIVFCIPCGNKEEKTLAHCDDEIGGCGKTWMQAHKRVPGLIPVQLMIAFHNLQTPLGITTAFMLETGRLSAEARQIMTKRAIEMGGKYILYWDDDTIPEDPMALYRMYNWMERNPHAGAISAVYCTRQNPTEPFIYKEHGKGAWWDFPMGPNAEPVQIFGAGAGFLLARVEAIQDVQMQMNGEENMDTADEIPMWLDEQVEYQIKEEDQEFEGIKTQTVTWGHDIRFCYLLNKHGWPVYVDGRTFCSHLDITTGKMFRMPSDAPGFQIAEGNLNTQKRWNDIYTHHGGNSFNPLPQLVENVTKEIGDVPVIELGCGTGDLAESLKSTEYKGYDISDVAAGRCTARGLDAEQSDVMDLPIEAFDKETLVATELMEHLDKEDFFTLMNRINASGVKKFVFTVPDNCMGPDQIPQHTALFNEDLVRLRMKGYTDWTLRIGKADEFRLLCVMER